MTARHITGALFVDMGQANRDGHYVKPPRARYECTVCRRTEGPVPDASTYQGTVRVVAVQTEGGTADGGPPQTVYVHRDHVDELVTAIREAAAALDCLPG